jgi:hypothetical protein
VIYCVVPALADEAVLQTLSAHFADHPQVKVIRETRTDGPVSRGIAELRHVTIPRRLAVPPECDSVDLQFDQWLSHVTANQASSNMDDLLRDAAAGSSDAAAELYWRMYEHIYQLVSAELKGPVKDAEPLIRIAFGRTLDYLLASPGSASDVERLLQHAITAAIAIREAELAQMAVAAAEATYPPLRVASLPQLAPAA